MPLSSPGAPVRVSDEVADTLAAGAAVVALESTLLAHGLPPDRNRVVADRLERTVRAGGAVPATIAVLDGRPTVGLSPAELDRVCDPAAGMVKLSRRDLGPAMSLGRSGATTVAGTMTLAHRAGVAVFATGGLGGVHWGAQDTWDVSADLDTLADTPVLVVCSGVKSILLIGATLEQLETKSVPVLGYRTDRFPAFYLRESDFDVPWRVDDPSAAATAFAAHRGLLAGGMVVANPVPAEHEMDRDLHDRLRDGGLAAVRERDASGKDVTPVMLEYFHTASDGVSLTVNEELVAANTALATEIATELTRA